MCLNGSTAGHPLKFEGTWRLSLLHMEPNQQEGLEKHTKYKKNFKGKVYSQAPFLSWQAQRCSCPQLQLYTSPVQRISPTN